MLKIQTKKGLVKKPLPFEQNSVDLNRSKNYLKWRYSEKYLKKMRLKYQVELIGSLQACLIAEKNKIYQYPLLPENLKRPEKDQLDRPAGNPQDR